MSRSRASLRPNKTAPKRLSAKNIVFRVAYFTFIRSSNQRNDFYFPLRKFHALVNGDDAATQLLKSAALTVLISAD